MSLCGQFSRRNPLKLRRNPRKEHDYLLLQGAVWLLAIGCWLLTVNYSLFTDSRLPTIDYSLFLQGSIFCGNFVSWYPKEVFDQSPQILTQHEPNKKVDHTSRYKQEFHHPVHWAITCFEHHHKSVLVALCGDGSLCV